MARRDPLDLYLDGCARVRATGAGTAETSYYPALSEALNAVGGALRPKVFALHHASGRKQAGIPDFGLFEEAGRRWPHTGGEAAVAIGVDQLPSRQTAKS